jgi:hypothetical protein
MERCLASRHADLAKACILIASMNIIIVIVIVITKHLIVFRNNMNSYIILFVLALVPGCSLKTFIGMQKQA